MKFANSKCKTRGRIWRWSKAEGRRKRERDADAVGTERTTPWIIHETEHNRSAPFRSSALFPDTPTPRTFSSGAFGLFSLFFPFARSANEEILCRVTRNLRLALCWCSLARLGCFCSRFWRTFFEKLMMN